MVNCEYIVLRYVPNPLRDEGINLGVILFDDRVQQLAGGRFRSDLSRVQCLDPNAHLEYVQELSADIQRRLSTLKDSAEIVELIEQNFSGLIQASERRPVQVESVAQALEDLDVQYLKAPKPVRASRQRGPRQVLLAGMRSAFQEAGTWEIMLHDVAASRYVPGDDLVIDCGYHPNGTVKLFHAVPLLPGPALAKGLAFTFPRLADGVRRREKLEAHLTAVVENDLDRKSDEIKFSLNALEENRIAIAAVSEMPKIAEGVRKDLRL